MTEVIEAVAVTLVGSDSTKCPFDCVSTCDATNVFSRQGKMGENVANGEPTIRYKKTEDGNFENCTDPIKPKYPPKNDKEFPNDWGWAAHHLIPVESLENHSIRKFLDKGYKGAKVSCDVGYNVNGVTNGKWLVASNAMYKKLSKGWVREVVLRECRRAGIKTVESLYVSLSNDAKENPEDYLGFREYLFATMCHYRLQFHDSHNAPGKYNDFVKLMLNKVKANLVHFDDSCPGGSQCKGAEKKPKAPHRIAKRFDFMSERLGRLLSGPPSSWRKPVFTSAYAEMLAKEVQ